MPYGSEGFGPSPFGSQTGTFGSSGSFFGNSTSPFGSVCPSSVSPSFPGSSSTSHSVPSISNQEHDAKLLKTGKFSDLILVVHGQEFKVHKALLTTRSPKFATLLTNHPTDTRLEIVDDISPQEFGKVLEFIYTGNVVDVGINDVNLIKHAITYDLPNLQNLVIQTMKKLVVHTITLRQGVEVVTTILATALANDNQDLRNFTLSAIINHWKVTKHAVKTCNDERVRSVVLDFFIEHSWFSCSYT
jgi:hypothetical protein